MMRNPDNVSLPKRKQFKHILPRSISIKLLLIFVVLMLPVYLSGIGIYRWGVRAIEKEMKESKRAQLRHSMSTLEVDIKNLKLLQSYNINDAEMNKIHNLGSGHFNYELSSSIRTLNKELLSIQTGSPYVHAVTAYFPKLERKLEAGRGLLPMSPSDEVEALEYGKRSSSGLYARDQGLYINSLYPLYPNPHERDIYYSLRIELSMPQILDYLDQYSIHESGCTTLYMDGQPLARTPGKSPNLVDNTEKVRFVIESEFLGLTLEHEILRSDWIHSLGINHSFIMWFTLFSAIMVLIYVLFLFRALRRPLNRLIDAFAKVHAGDLEVRIEASSKDEFHYLYYAFNDMVKSLNELINKNYRQQFLLKEAELKQLHNQINPHFFYNSYFLLHRMIKSYDQENAVEFSKQMGEYFRYITYQGQDEVPICREIEHAKAYANIQKKRFEDGVDIRFEEVPEVFSTIRIPKLVLQPILENTFEHAFKNMIGLKRLYIRYEYTGDALRIIADDNCAETSDETIRHLQQTVGIPRSEWMSSMETSLASTEHHGIGLINIHRRLQLRYDGESGLRFERSPLGGLRVILHIENLEEHHD